MTMFDTDVLIVGGGPGGLATALQARRQGLSVIVAEPRESPIDKACGEGLMPGGLAELTSLGVDPAGMPFYGIAYRNEHRRAEARFRTGPGRGVRRTLKWFRTELANGAESLQAPEPLFVTETLRPAPTGTY